ncbi:MAG: thiamine pyrophosphokinase, partial [Gemmobacter sp.]|nr:thiamine pyrophosphokinase [Gemmobacter sp.]
TPPCVVLSGRELTFLAPPEIRLRLPVGLRLSLFPMGSVTGQSEGLRWPIDGLTFTPDGRIGTSNQVTDADVRLRFNARRMLVILPLKALDAVLNALSDVRGG